MDESVKPLPCFDNLPGGLHPQRHQASLPLLRPPPQGYGRTVATVFPSGTYIKGGAYGDDVNLPIPIEERNNPNFSGCLDRNP